jgi:large subunit ribosomal protein L4
MKIPIYSKDGKKIDSVDVSKQWEEVPRAKQAVKDAVVYYLANKRQGNAKAKDRSEVNFTTRKPWAQKGTGRARSGTASSPIWRKGGVVFGPKPRDYSIDLPKKVRKLALMSILGDKLRKNEIILVDSIDVDKPKTKKIFEFLKKLESGSKPLLVTKDNNRNVYLSVRNIPGVGFSRAIDLNTYEVAAHGKLVVEKEAWSLLETKILGQ